MSAEQVTRDYNHIYMFLFGNMFHEFMVRVSLRVPVLLSSSVQMVKSALCPAVPEQLVGWCHNIKTLVVEWKILNKNL